MEIEELAKGLGQCTVRPSGCLGNCNQAPNAIIVKSRQESLCARIRDVERSAAVVQQATGRAPNMEDPERTQRLGDARQMRIREEARKSNKWNAALNGFAEHIARSSGNKRLQLQFEHSRLLSSAGHLELAAESVAEVAHAVPDEDEVWAEYAQILAKLGRADKVDEIRKMFPEGLRLGKCEPEKTRYTNGHYSIENYSLWVLDAVTVVSKHSAVYHFSTKDLKRGTPNPRGRGRTVWPKTWHTTLLAEVGQNGEGPLPWIERDYTPISSAKAWESGKVDILIKIYATGLATSWLSKKPVGCKVWLSKPARTLGIPSLAPDIVQAKLTRPASVLLVLAGSGIVVASQVLQHQDPATNLGVNTPGLLVPVNLIYSCRKDDVCMVADLTAWCRSGLTSNGLPRGLMRGTLLLTESQAEGSAAPFPDGKDPDFEEFEALANTSVLQTRLSTKLLIEELSRMQSPCRIVVSGPETFNAAVRSMLVSSGVDTDAITILEA